MKTYAVDRNKLLKYVMNGSASDPAIYGIVPPVMPNYDATSIKGYSFDLEKAREVYAEIQGSAYTDEKGNEIKCPKCESTDLFTEYSVRKGAKGFFSSLSAFVITMVPFWSKKMYKCKKCGEEFKRT